MSITGILGDFIAAITNTQNNISHVIIMMIMMITMIITRLENVAIANALQLEVPRATPALFRFNYDAMPSLKSPLPYCVSFCC